MKRQRSKEQAPEACGCRACHNLRDECGEANYPFYAKRLLVKGWSGQLTAVERAYRRAHSEAAQKAAARGAANAGRLRETATAARNIRNRHGQLSFSVTETGAAQ